MEYLMTYGWALLVIVIVVAILLILNPFAAPQACKFEQIGFTCENPAIDTNGVLYASIGNGNNNAVNITRIVCTNSKSSNPPAGGGTVINKLVGRQDYLVLNSTTNVVCSNVPRNAGVEYSGKIWVFYRNIEDGPGYPERTASANIVTKTLSPSQG